MEDEDENNISVSCDRKTHSIFSTQAKKRKEARRRSKVWERETRHFSISLRRARQSLVATFSVRERRAVWAIEGGELVSVIWGLISSRDNGDGEGLPGGGANAGWVEWDIRKGWVGDVRRWVFL